MAVREEFIGTELEGRYKVLSRLGEGGMGTVYVAEHLRLGSRCAIKVLRTELCQSARARERFLREAKIASQLGEHNSNIVKVMDLGFLPDGSAFFVMEWLQGENLGSTLTRANRLPWGRVRHFAMQICEALAGAHAAGIVHRDLKPDNCFRVQVGGDSDFVKLLDFGVAHMNEPEGGKLTEQGEALGTAAYMSPEQAAGKGGDYRIDIYALGAMIYEMLTGYLPFEGNNAWQVRAKIISEDVMPMSELCPEADIGPELEALVATAMHRDPGRRFASISAMAAAIAAVRVQDPGPVASVPTPGPSHRATAYAPTILGSLGVDTSPTPAPETAAPPSPSTLAPAPPGRTVAASGETSAPAAPATASERDTAAPSSPSSQWRIRGLGLSVAVVMVLGTGWWLRPDTPEQKLETSEPSTAPASPAPPSAEPPHPALPSPVQPAPAPAPSPAPETPSVEKPPSRRAASPGDVNKAIKQWRETIQKGIPEPCRFSLEEKFRFMVVAGADESLALKDSRAYQTGAAKLKACSADIIQRFSKKKFPSRNAKPPVPDIIFDFVWPTKP